MVHSIHFGSQNSCTAASRPQTTGTLAHFGGGIGDSYTASTAIDTRKLNLIEQIRLHVVGAFAPGDEALYADESLASLRETAGELQRTTAEIKRQYGRLRLRKITVDEAISRPHGIGVPIRHKGMLGQLDVTTNQYGPRFALTFPLSDTEFIYEHTAGKPHAWYKNSRDGVAIFTAEPGVVQAVNGFFEALCEKAGIKQALS